MILVKSQEDEAISPVKTVLGSLAKATGPAHLVPFIACFVDPCLNVLGATVAKYDKYILVLPSLQICKISCNLC